MEKENSFSKYHVPNLERALKIMEYLAESSVPVSMSDIARSLKYPNNSVFRIVSTLEESGYLLRDPESKNYQLSRKLLSLGYQALSESSLIEKSMDILRALREESGETALIGTLLEGEGVVLEQVPSHEPVKIVVTQGAKFPLHAAAPAKAMLAFFEEGELRRQLSMMKYTRFNENTICTEDAFRLELEKVRRDGYAIDAGEAAEGIICVSAPIFDYRGRPGAAIWITGPEFRIFKRAPEELGETVLRHAERLSQRLGYKK